MAARIRRIANDENTRAKIQTTQLIKRLTDHALGTLDLTSTQIKAIEILIRKTLPDLQAVSVEADVDVEMGIYEIERRIVKAPDPNG